MFYSYSFTKVTNPPPTTGIMQGAHTNCDISGPMAMMVTLAQGQGLRSVF